MKLLYDPSGWGEREFWHDGEVYGGTWKKRIFSSYEKKLRVGESVFAKKKKKIRRKEDRHYTCSAEWGENSSRTTSAI